MNRVWGVERGLRFDGSHIEQIHETYEGALNYVKTELLNEHWDEVDKGQAWAWNYEFINIQSWDLAE